VTRGSIGVRWDRNPKPEVLKAMGFNGGVLVRDVKKDGPADKAGLQAEDVIVALNGKPVKDGDDLMARVADTPVGNSVMVTVDRDGKAQTFKLTIQDRTQVFADEEQVVGSRRQREDPTKPEVEPGKFGIGVRPASDQEKSATGAKQGVVVTRVESSSFADDIGLAEKDVITSINRKPVSSKDDIVAIQKTLKVGDPVVFRVVRQSGPRNIQTASGVRYDTQYLSGTLPEN
jgi:serine protease Do